MANEAVIIEIMGQPKGVPIRFAVADVTGIEKGTICKLSDPRTASASSISGDIFCGIASVEKVANDGSTSLGLFTKGIFDLKDSGTGITAGDLVKIDGANLISTWTGSTDLVAGDKENLILGKALETAAANEVIAVGVGVF